MVPVYGHKKTPGHTSKQERRHNSSFAMERVVPNGPPPGNPSKEQKSGQVGSSAARSYNRMPSMGLDPARRYGMMSTNNEDAAREHSIRSSRNHAGLLHHGKHWHQPRSWSSHATKSTGRGLHWPGDQRPQAHHSSPKHWRPSHLSTMHHTPTPSKSHWEWKSEPTPYHTAPVRLYDIPKIHNEQQDHRRVLVAISNEEAVPPDSGSVQSNVDEAVEAKKDSCKRSISPSPEATTKRVKGLDGLDLLVMASLEMVPLKESPSGCSCPKSKCIALYCECFKAGRRCDHGSCTCVGCKNTIDESGPQGARTLAIRSILARNPRAFSSANNTAPKQPLPPGQVAAIASDHAASNSTALASKAEKCAKRVYAAASAALNTEESAERQFAIESTLQKRPDAFRTRVKEVGLGCACKNNKCVRKYCECFRSNLVCTEK
eukprot:CAMPEP_0172474486 /NCGR_PEP_ID=MMETSP1065-20121228/69383_1 /TAXON_ID=265537 /ORGANISM="Amphiprora paludosa, Strain CCMP125" /LENGTH=431 /DNA_ID=CAMNT_0013232669 /DNA_START=965 /DNA_END=2257 /DNA_ORIENTATION=-